jgi:hypothetical protein
MRQKAGLLLALVFTLGVLLSALGCSGYYRGGGFAYGPKEGPPPWAPAHGYREKHQYNHHYYYYPQVRIYYNLDRKVYYYYYEGQWRIASSLPHNVKIRGDYVELGMDTDKPFRYHREVEKKYPPGQMKDKDKRGRGRGPDFD